jgi:ubiquinone/menaquinone biosynthesis C-methylase UbiE
MTGTVAAQYDGQAESYARTRVQNASFRTQCRLIEGWIRTRSGHLLDVGCGSGDFLALTGGRFARCTGVDVSPRMIEAARRTLAHFRAVDLHVGDASALPIADDQVNVLVTMGVIEFVDDLDQMLRECRRVLAPNGRLLITTQHGSCLAKQAGGWLRSSVARIRRRPATPSWRRRPAAIREALRRAGFSVHETEYCGVRVFPWPLSDVPRLVRPVESMLERVALLRNNPWLGSVYAICADRD